jgi:hypothetical protein
LEEFNSTPDVLSMKLTIDPDGTVRKQGDAEKRCAMDAGKTVMACVGSWSTGAPGTSEMAVFVRKGKQGASPGSTSPQSQGATGRATVTFADVDSGTGTGTLSLQGTAFGLESQGFSAAPPDFISIGSGRLIPSSPQVGQTWTDQGISNNHTIQTTVTVASTTDSVTVPAGTFPGCLRTEEINGFSDEYVRSSGGLAPNRRTRWFASGVGPIKYETTYIGPGGVARGTNTGVLVSRSLKTTGSADWWPLASGNTWTFQESDQAAPCTWTVTVYSP